MAASAEKIKAGDGMDLPNGLGRQLRVERVMEVVLIVLPFVGMRRPIPPRTGPRRVEVGCCLLTIQK